MYLYDEYKFVYLYKFFIEHHIQKLFKVTYFFILFYFILPSFAFNFR